MNSQNNRRLSDVTKKNTSDRASKLASSFLADDDDTIAPVAAKTQISPPVVNPLPENQPADEITPGPDPSVREATETLKEKAGKPAETKPAKKEGKARKAGPHFDLPELINQPIPEGMSSTKMIALTEKHHDMLRELHFLYKKPLVAVLYNLLEPAYEALQRDLKKTI